MRLYTRNLPKAGEKFGNLTLTGGYHAETKKELKVEIQCECGKLFFSTYRRIRIGKTKSCGCKSSELKSKAMTIHGLCLRGKTHPVYRAWYGIWHRCYNTKSKYYINYGGRGIKVCQEWLDDFFVFYNWAIENGWRKWLTIERIDVNGDYSPANCKWITNLEQQKNKTTSRFIEVFGEIKIAADWGRDERSKVSVRTFCDRLKKGWNAEDALTIVLRAA